MNEFLKAMGTRIMTRRKELGLTQEQVAELANFTAQTVSTAERGEKALRPENIVKLCTVLDVSPNYLLLGEAANVQTSSFPARIAKLSPKQRQFLDCIIESYPAAISLNDEEE